MEALLEVAQLIDRMGAPMAISGLDGRFSAVNEAYADLLGVTPDELVGRSFAAVTYADDVRLGLALLRELAAGERATGRMTKRYQRPDGSLVWAETSLSVLRDDVGRPVGIASQVRPADGPSMEEVSLRDSEERFRAAFDNSPVGVAVIGLGGEVLRANRSLCSLLGRPADELVGVRFGELIHPDDLRSAERARADLLDGRIGSLRIERRFLHSDGSVLWGQVTATLIRDGDGQPVHFLVHLVDLSPRAGGVGEPERAFLQQLAGESDDLLFYRLRIQPKLRFEYVSESIAAFSGYSSDDFLADPHIMFDLVHPDDSSVLMDLITDPQGAAGELLIRWRRHDGSELATKVHSAPVYVDDELVGVEGVLVDITAQRRAERAHERSESRFRALVQNSTEALIITDADGTITYLNPSVERILGWQVPLPVRSSIWHVVHPADATTFRRLHEEPGSPAHVRLLTDGGEWRWLDAVVTDLLDDPAVGGIVINARDVHDQHLAEEALRTNSLTDGLTQLPNRALLEDRIARTLMRASIAGSLATVLTVDIDRFSSINSTLGYRTGDEVLIALAARLVRATSSSHTVGRFAGDEFIVCAEGFPDTAAVRAYAEQLRSELCGPVAVGGTTVDLEVTVGVGVADGEHGSTQELLGRSSDAVRQAKDAGEGIAVFDANASDQVQARQRRVLELQGAAQRGELETYYQPIIDLESGEIVAAEALMRWHHPVEGLVPPDQFIPMAEQTGAITTLGAWIVQDVAARLARWRAEEVPALTVSVNLSARQLGDHAVIDMLTSALAGHGLPPGALTVEVTESAALGPGHLGVLREIDALGIPVALDDFGTHYSSLAYLQWLPLQQLKIDRSFVTGLEHDRSQRAIIMATAQLARGLRLRTVAEGVETEREASELHLFGIDRAQGYHFGRPMPAEDFRRHLRGHRAATR